MKQNNKRKKKNFLKFKLMIVSLSPLALLTIIRNFSFVMPDKTKEHCCLLAVVKNLLNIRETVVHYTVWQFIEQNLVLLVVMFVCLLWLLAAIVCFLSFRIYMWVDNQGGYTIKDIVEKEDASLNFFLTLIIPLLMDDVATIQGAITFGLIVLSISLLLYNTKLFYANPVLAMLGYRVYEFRFEQNAAYNEKCLTAVALGKLSGVNSIEYKDITEDGVLFVKERKKQ